MRAITHISVFLLSFLFSVSICAAQEKQAEENLREGSFLENLQQRDSILIGDQVRYGFRLFGLDKSKRIALPDWKSAFPEGVEVLSPWIVDTLKKSKSKGNDIEAFVVLTSFDEGLYELPYVPVVICGPDGASDTLVFKNEWLSVWEMPIDTATFVPHDIKGQIRYPITFAEVIPWVGMGLGICAIIALAVWFIITRRKKAASAKADEPAHIVALRKLDALRKEKLWEPEKQKEYFSAVTDALREYMASRYGMGAMEMTTTEIFAALSSEELPPELYEQLKDLFEQTDFIKFAKSVATKEEAAGAVPLAVRFVTTTYQSDVDKEADREVAKNQEGK